MVLHEQVAQPAALQVGHIDPIRANGASVGTGQNDGADSTAVIYRGVQEISECIFTVQLTPDVILLQPHLHIVVV